jgi:hypothetical protein
MLRNCKYCNKILSFNRKKYCSQKCGYKDWITKNRKYYQKYYLEHREKINTSNVNWKKRNKDKLKNYYKSNKYKKVHNNASKKYLKKYPEKYPEKYKAHYIADNNIKISENQLCEICNERLAIHRHHEDYLKPLEVTLCCRKCHKEITDRK